MTVMDGAFIAALAGDGTVPGTGSGTPFDWLAPILSTGVVGIIMLMIIFRIKIMPTYVHDDAKAEWDRERAEMRAQWDREREEMRTEAARERAQYEREKADLTETVKDAHMVYTTQVIPTLTRVLDAERELVDIRRDEASRRRRNEG